MEMDVVGEENIMKVSVSAFSFGGRGEEERKFDFRFQKLMYTYGLYSHKMFLL